MKNKATRNPTEEFREAADMFKADQRNMDARHIFAGQPISAEMFREWVSEYDIPEHCPGGCQINCVSGHVINSTEGGRQHGYQARTYRRTFI